MNYPSQSERVEMGAVMSLLGPVGFAFWMSLLGPMGSSRLEDPAEFLGSMAGWFVMSLIVGAIPFLLSWYVGFRPFVKLGVERPRVTSVLVLVCITGINGAVWGILLTWLNLWMLPVMTLAGIGPGLGYGIWLRFKLRAVDRFRPRSRAGIQRRDAQLAARASARDTVSHTSWKFSSSEYRTNSGGHGLEERVGNFVQDFLAENSQAVCDTVSRTVA